MSNQLRIGVRAVLCALLLSLGPWAARSARAAIECTQSAIQSVSPPNTTVLSATAQSEPVAYCDVLGYVTTTHPRPNQVNFELGLPGEWNGRFLFVGNGGFGGSFDFPSIYLDNLTFFPLLTEVSAGFATAITDTGHQGNFVDGSWALNDLSKQDDWLFRGVHVTAVAGQTISKRFYGRAAHSYFAGCSDGGREGLVEAQKYPTDFDGIIAGDPDLGDAAVGFNWNEERITSQSENYVSPDKVALLGKAVMASCDAADGVVDRLIQDPRKCAFDPVGLLCSEKGSSNCLTPGEVATIKAIYSGASTEDGRQVYPGFAKSDPGTDDWTSWITDLESPNAPGTAEPWVDPESPPLQFIFQDQFLKFLVFNDSNYNSLSFDLNSSDLANARAVIHRGGAAATDPDLSAFREHGGKLILYHGWSDPALTPLETVEYYEAIMRKTGHGYHDTLEFARLFMAPGMAHCIGAGTGPNVFDPLSSLIDWVENDVAPRRILAVHYKDNDPTTGIVTRTMPLCPYPEMARFNGGDLKKARNWACRQLEN